IHNHVVCSHLGHAKHRGNHLRWSLDIRDVEAFAELEPICVLAARKAEHRRRQQQRRQAVGSDWLARRKHARPPFESWSPLAYTSSLAFRDVPKRGGQRRGVVPFHGGGKGGTWMVHDELFFH